MVNKNGNRIDINDTQLSIITQKINLFELQLIYFFAEALVMASNKIKHFPSNSVSDNFPF